jgi:hypothetical protein
MFFSGFALRNDHGDDIAENKLAGLPKGRRVSPQSKVPKATV